MGDRYELLARARRILADPALDGVVASGDVLEDLFFLNYLERKQSGRSFLDGRLLVGSMYRETVADTLRDYADGLASSSRVRGAIIGRNLLFPSEADPLPM